MNKEAVYALLRAQGIPFEVTEHGAVYTMAELKDVPLPYPEADAKNIFVRDDKKQNYFLITVRGNKRVNIREFRRTFGTRPLSFASAEELFDILALTPGSVTPFGLLNDDERKVRLILDSDFRKEPGLIGIHPNDNTATVCLRTDDLTNIITEHGNSVEFYDIKTL